MPPVLLTLPASNEHLVLDVPPTRACPGCHVATAIFIVRLVGLRNVATCAACAKAA